MPIELRESLAGKVLLVYISGKLNKEDYATFVPEVQRMLKAHGKIRILVRMHDFQGWTPGAFWEDTKFTAQHFSDIERLAIVGEKKWQETMSIFCKPFTKAVVRYFDRSEADQARAWVQETQADDGGLPPATPGVTQLAAAKP